MTLAVTQPSGLAHAGITLNDQIHSYLSNGDLSKMSSDEQVTLYRSVCYSLGLNPGTQPLNFIKMNGKTVLYARKDATDQLRKLHGISVSTSASKSGDIMVVKAIASDRSGRKDEDIGAVSVKGLTGESLANAMMKATTKAKRRVTLSICGLGMLDQSEVDESAGMEPHELPPDQYGDPEMTDAMVPLVDSLLSSMQNADAEKYADATIDDVWRMLCASAGKNMKTPDEAFIRTAISKLESKKDDEDA